MRFQERPRDKVRRRITLLVSARCDGMTGQADTACSSDERWAWRLSLSASYPVGATITVVPRDNNKTPNGSGVRIRVGCVPIRTASARDNGYGPLRVVCLYRKLFRRHNLCGLIAGIGCYCLALVMGRWVCFAGQTRNVQEYKGRWARDPCVLRI